MSLHFPDHHTFSVAILAVDCTSSTLMVTSSDVETLCWGTWYWGFESPFIEIWLHPRSVFWAQAGEWSVGAWSGVLADLQDRKVRNRALGIIVKKSDKACWSSSNTKNSEGQNSSRSWREFQCREKHRLGKSQTSCIFSSGMVGASL